MEWTLGDILQLIIITMALEVFPNHVVVKEED